MSNNTPHFDALMQRFLESLGSMPTAKARLEALDDLSIDLGYDAKVSLSVGGKSFVLMVEQKSRAYPRDVRQALWRHESLSATKSCEVLQVLMSPSISTGARQELQNAGVGYFDGSGSLYLPLAGAYVYIDRPAPKSTDKAARSLFSGARGRVLQALLLHKEQSHQVRELAEVVEVAPSTVSDVLQELELREWVESRGEGRAKERRLIKPAALLDAWSQVVVRQRPLIQRKFFVPGFKAETLMLHMGNVFENNRVRYAVSFEAAAQQYAPFLSSLSQVKVRLVPGIHAEDAFMELDARSVSEGANLVVIETVSAADLLFLQRAHGVWLANPIQVYLDLLRSESRGKEAAEHLRSTKIGF